MVGGSAQIVQRSPDRLEVNQASDRAAINWSSFSINRGESVTFNQPNANAVILNRVTGGSRSEINGLLRANGNVVVVNPSGVLFGRDSRVDVAGIVATTTDIPVDRFMAGSFTFDGPGRSDGIVANQGEISVRDGGLAAFVAPAVANAGRIQARLGRVTLASGHKFTVDLYGDKLVSLQVGDAIAEQLRGPDGQPLSARVSNAGRIDADGGIVVLTVDAARSIVDNVINTTGILRARQAVEQGGKIILQGRGGHVRVAGTVDAQQLVAIEGGSALIDGNVRGRAADSAIFVRTNALDLRGTLEAGSITFLNLVAGPVPVSIGKPATSGARVYVGGTFGLGVTVRGRDADGDGILDVTVRDPKFPVEIFADFTPLLGGLAGIGSRDLNGDGIPDLALPAIPAGAFASFRPGGFGGVAVGAGDINGDGIPDLVTSPGIPSVSPRSLAALSTAFPRGGVSVSTGDVTGDGRPDIAVAPASVGFAGGVAVSSVDVNADGVPDVVVRPVTRLDGFNFDPVALLLSLRSRFPEFSRVAREAILHDGARAGIALDAVVGAAKPPLYTIRGSSGVVVGSRKKAAGPTRKS